MNYFIISKMMYYLNNTIVCKISYHTPSNLPQTGETTPSPFASPSLRRTLFGEGWGEVVSRNS